MGGDAVRVLIVDDSVIFRNFLRGCLANIPCVEVVGAARDGLDGMEKIKTLKPDLITLDMEMPKMNGMQVLAALGDSDDKLEVIVVTGTNSNDTERTVKALEAGAFDFVIKPTTSDKDPKGTLVKVLTEKIVLAKRKIRGAARRVAAPTQRAPTRIEAQRRKMAAAKSGVVSDGPVVKRARTLRGRPDIVAIGSSTGGPKALHALFAALSGDIPVPLVLTQHMPKLFLVSLAKRINDISPLGCVVAEEGMELKSGVIHVAPGERHMEIVRKGGKLVATLTDGPKVHHCKPSVDPMFFSLAKLAPTVKIVSVVLTGMGADGAAGALEIGNKGGHVIAQDEKTSVVWGMPGATAKMGAAHEILPLNLIDEAIMRFFVTKGR